MITLLFLIFSYNFRDNNIHRERKKLGKDISLPLGDVSFRCSYRIHEELFYALHNLLAPELLKHSFPKNGGLCYILENSYLIKTGVRLSLAIRLLRWWIIGLVDRFDFFRLRLWRIVTMLMNVVFNIWFIIMIRDVTMEDRMIWHSGESCEVCFVLDKDEM